MVDELLMLDEQATPDEPQPTDGLQVLD